METKVKQTDIFIQNDHATWNMVHLGALGGRYEGTFKFSCFLSPMQVISADKDYRDLLGNNPTLASSLADNLAYALSQLKYRVLEAPPFWNDGSRFPGSSVKDIDVIDLVLEASIVAEIKYREELSKRHEDAIVKLKTAIQQKEEAEKLNEELNNE